MCRRVVLPTNRHSGQCFWIAGVRALLVMAVQAVALALLRVSRLIHQANPNAYMLSSMSIHAFIACYYKFLPATRVLLCSLALLTSLQGAYSFLCRFGGVGKVRKRRQMLALIELLNKHCAKSRHVQKVLRNSGKMLKQNDLSVLQTA